MDTAFFMPTPSKTAKKMPNYDIHAKRHFFMPNHFKKWFALKIYYLINFNFAIRHEVHVAMDPGSTPAGFSVFPLEPDPE